MSNGSTAIAGYDTNEFGWDNDGNFAKVVGDKSGAQAGPGDNNKATATGDFVNAVAVGGTEVNCTPAGCS